MIILKFLLQGRWLVHLGSLCTMWEWDAFTKVVAHFSWCYHVIFTRFGQWCHDLWCPIFHFFGGRRFKITENISCCVFLFRITDSTLFKLLLWESSICCGEFPFSKKNVQIDHLLYFCMYCSEFRVNQLAIQHISVIGIHWVNILRRCVHHCWWWCDVRCEPVAWMPESLLPLIYQHF